MKKNIVEKSDNLDLSKIFRSNLQILQAKLDIIRSAMQHATTKGTMLEHAVEDFLSYMLPSNLGIAAGFIVDFHGDISKQVDLIIYDKYKAAKFFSSSGVVTIPCEFVYCVIEVKTTLQASELKEVHEHMLSVKELDRSAVENIGKLVQNDFLFYGIVYSNGKLPPPIYIVFALESGGLQNIKTELEKFDKNTEVDNRIDFIFTPDACITNFDTKANSSSLTPYQKNEEHKLMADTIRIVHPAIQKDGGFMTSDDQVQKAKDDLALWFYAILSKYTSRFTLGNYNFDFLKYYNQFRKKK